MLPLVPRILRQVLSANTQATHRRTASDFSTLLIKVVKIGHGDKKVQPAENRMSQLYLKVLLVSLEKTPRIRARLPGLMQRPNL
jgi:hypothetical protein